MKPVELKDGASADIVHENVQQLKELFPEAFTEDGVDFSTLRQLLGDLKVLDEGEEKYGLNWHGKKQARQIALDPSLGTLLPCPEESVDWDTTQNLFIEGDNLEVLKLLQKSYANKVKMIYIDPPYNTGNEFIYPDKFKDNLDTYLKYTGQIDDEGMKFSSNTEASGRKHTNWLNMMFPRLKLARNLLRDDGVIFISIDDNEHSNLQKLCNEFFGEENFVADLVWKKRVSPANDSQWYSSDHEYLCVYAKNKAQWFPNKTQRTEEHDKYYKNPDNDPRGAWNSAAYTCNKSKSERPNLYYPIKNPFTGEEVWPDENAVWAYSQETHRQHIEEDILYWGTDGQSKAPRKKQYLTDAKPIVPRSVLDYQEVGSTQTATLEARNLFEGASFSYPKSTGLLKKIIYQATNADDLILDFFGGSCTTAHSTFQLNATDGNNRRFIMVQLPETCDQKSEEAKAGYATIAEIGKERIRLAAKKIKDENPDYKGDLGFKVFKLASSNIKVWNPDPSDLENSLLEHEQHLIEGRSEQDVLYELLLKRGVDLTTPIETRTIASKNVYSIGYGKIITCLDDSISTDDVEALAGGIVDWQKELMNTLEVVTLETHVFFKDSAFSDDVAKTNIAAILAQNGIGHVRSL